MELQMRMEALEARVNRLGKQNAEDIVDEQFVGTIEITLFFNYALRDGLKAEWKFSGKGYEAWFGQQWRVCFDAKYNQFLESGGCFIITQKDKEWVLMCCPRSSGNEADWGPKTFTFSSIRGLLRAMQELQIARIV